MFTRRLGPVVEHARCSGAHSCPGVLELVGGDVAIIGTDITLEATGKLPAGEGCGPSERIVRIPRSVFREAQAKLDAPQP